MTTKFSMVFIFRILMVLTSFFFVKSPIAQINSDSLIWVWNNPEFHDTIRLNALSEAIAKIYVYKDLDSALYYAKLGEEFVQNKNLPIHKGDVYMNIGTVYFYRGEIDQASDFFKKSYSIFKKNNAKIKLARILNNLGAIEKAKGKYIEALAYYQEGVDLRLDLGMNNLNGGTYSNIGEIYNEIGKQAQAIEYFYKGLELHEKNNSAMDIAITKLNLSNIYESQQDYYKAIQLCTEALNIFDKIDVLNGKAMALNNIGNAYYALKEQEKSLEYYNEALVVFNQIKDNKSVISTYLNISEIYLNSNQLDLAEANAIQALELARLLNDKMSLIPTYTTLGKIELIRKNYSKSLRFLEDSKSYAEEVGSLKYITRNLSALHVIYKETSNYKKALETYEELMLLEDSLTNEKNQRELIRNEYQYQYDKKAAEDSIKTAEARKLTEAQLKAQDEQIAKEKTQRIALYGGVAFLFLFGGFMYNRFRVTKKQSEVIATQKHEVEQQRDRAEKQHQEAERQKKIVEEKQTEIIDSIQYAKRLQNAIFPRDEKINKWLPESFILFKPKDIVAGDFYFLDVVEHEKEQLIYYVAADCTGHGVPGAMVSIVGANGLKRCIQEFGLRKPGEILDQLSQLVVDNFIQGTEKIRDGMDLALCCLVLKNDRVTCLHYAGANNPLWIINPERKEWPSVMKPFKEHGGAELKATKQAIGYSESPVKYKTHTIDVQKGDTLYTFSDGFADQFGGDAGKKFKSANFKKLLLSICDKSMTEQKNILNKEFENWKGELEQIDDVCVIGVRL